MGSSLPTTVVSDPEGKTRVINSGDQRLATAGSGDVLAGIIGAFLVKSQGISILNKAIEEVKLNKMPLMPIFEGIAILIAGAFLLTPGFLTDTLGCFLLIPKTRNILIKLMSVVSLVIAPFLF